MHGSTCSTPSRLLRVTLHLLLVHADNLRHLSLFRVFLLLFSVTDHFKAEPASVTLCHQQVTRGSLKRLEQLRVRTLRVVKEVVKDKAIHTRVFAVARLVVPALGTRLKRFVEVNDHRMRLKWESKVGNFDLSLDF